MTENILITISCGTDNPNRATRGLFLAAVAQKKGKNVTVFLLDDGVYLAREGAAAHLKAATGDSADDSLAHLQAHGVPGNQTRAAQILGVSRITVWKRMKKYNVSIKSG